MTVHDVAVPSTAGPVTPVLLDTTMVSSDLIAVVQGKRAPWIAPQAGHRQVMADLREVLHVTSLFHEATPGRREPGRRDVGATLYRAAVPTS